MTSEPVPQSRRIRARSVPEAKDRHLRVLRQSVRCIHDYVSLELGPLGENSFRLVVTSERRIMLTPAQSGQLYLNLGGPGRRVTY